MEHYRYSLDEAEAPDSQEDYESWWRSRFATGVWGAPPKKPRGDD